jgi:neutral ceramidase
VGEATFLVGRGVSDITGEAAGCGMLGYGKADQQTEGIHTRQRSRAFVIAEEDGPRVLIVVNDLPLVFDSVHQEVLRRLHRLYGDLYTARNTMLTATHTHCAPGGYSHHLLYNSNTKGFRPKTFGALVDGIVEAVARAHADLAPSQLTLAHGELHDASVNRSRVAFERNPAADRAFFPQAIDPQTTLLRIERDGKTVGAINWFATHNTSMTNQNHLISSDNKGYAGYYWERVVEGIDYVGGLDPSPGFIGAFAQTNAGDMSPNLNLHPGSGPTEDEFENTRIIGRRQYDAASALAAQDGVEVRGPLNAHLVYVDLAHVTVRPSFTGDGLMHSTSGPAGGSASFAGAWVDGPGFPGFREGRNPGWDWPSTVAYRLSPSLRDSQSPKGIVLPGGLLNRVLPVVAQRVPVQLLRIGPLYLIGIPGEVTITAGLRLRRTVAGIVGADLQNVLVAGYSNGYIHYVTTPEEYDAQQYEGGSTLFGRWELPALQQTAAALARAMQSGSVLPEGNPTADLSHRFTRHRDRRGPDAAPRGTSFGAVVVEPRSAYAAGQRATVTFVGAHPDNELHRGGTYLEVQRSVGDGWVTVRDDGDWDTRFAWKQGLKGESEVTVSWDIPEDAAPGRYRIRYLGEAKDDRGVLHGFAGLSPVFVVTVPAPCPISHGVGETKDTEIV